MALLTLGINHKTAPVAVRERMAFVPDQLPHTLRLLREELSLAETAILSTCNRTEIYGYGNKDSVQQLTQWLSQKSQLSQNDLHQYLYHYPGRQAVRHLMRVATGLDSMVIGEPQILGQMKSAWRVAHQAGTLGTLLNRLFQSSFSVAKQVRTETEIGSHPVSVAYAAVRLTRQVLGDLSRCTALLVGAGETIELAARHLHNQKIGHMVVANRTLSRACALAEPLDGAAISLAGVAGQLPQADIVIAAIGGQQPLITHAMMHKAIQQRRRRPVFIADLSVPRCIDHNINQLEDVYLYGMDELQQVVNTNQALRRNASNHAEAVIEQHADRFMAWWQSRGVVDTIRDLRHQSMSVRDRSLEAALQQLRRGAEPERVLTRLASQLTNRLMHHPSAALSQLDNPQEEVALARRLFDLDSSSP